MLGLLACWVLGTMTATLCAVACAAAASAIITMYAPHSHACSNLQETCKICFESFPVADMHCARCKHYYCKASHQYLVAAWQPAADRQLLLPLSCGPAADDFCCWRRCLHCCWHVHCCWHGRCSAVVTVPVPLAGLLHSTPQDCWRGYIQTAIDSGPSCLDLRCPDPGAAFPVWPCLFAAASDAAAARTAGLPWLLPPLLLLLLQAHTLHAVHAACLAPAMNRRRVQGGGAAQRGD